MSIRLIAKDLYRIRGQVEQLERELKSAPREKQEAIEDVLRKKKAEQTHLRKMLEGAKEPPLCRMPR